MKKRENFSSPFFASHQRPPTSSPSLSVGKRMLRKGFGERKPARDEKYLPLRGIDLSLFMQGKSPQL